MTDGLPGDDFEKPEDAQRPSGVTGYESKHTYTERLDWLLRHITGSELRDMGVELAWTADPTEARSAIDAKIDS